MNLLVIANDQRILSLLKRFQPFVKARVSFVSDFDLGLKEVFRQAARSRIYPGSDQRCFG